MNNVINSEGKISHSDLVNYWMKFFPEINKVKEFEKIIKEISNKDLESLIEEWENNTRSNSNKETVIFEEAYSSVIEMIFRKIDVHNLQFFNFFEPIIKYYINKYYENIIKIKNIYNHELFIHDIIKQVYKKLYPIAYRVLILEINIAKKKNILDGDSTEERFKFFSNTLLKNVNFLKGLFKEYKELISLLLYQAEVQIQYIIDIIEDTNSQLFYLYKKFKGLKGNSIKTISIGLGDAHQGGKSVSFINFTSGYRLVYKPRSLEMEDSYEKLLRWFNNKAIPNFKPLYPAKIHYTDNSGWMEFIEFKQCNNIKEIKDFYYRTGQLLCLLYALNSKDFHHENLIAQGSQPILVDLESLLHVDVGDPENEEKDSMSFIERMVKSSVYSIYLLPSRIISSGETNVQVLDVGGLNGHQEQKSPFKTSVVANSNTDEIKIEKDYTVISPENNNPKVNGKVQASQYYIDDIEEGFTCLYNWILENKQMFIKKISDLFSQIKCRAILKPTFVYSRLLHTSFHPDVLRNPIDRNILLGRIAISSLKRNVNKVSFNEVKDLLRGDIPYFTAYTNSSRIETSRNEVVEDFYIKSSPLDNVREKILSFSSKDLEKQLTIIDLSFAHNATDKNRHTPGVTFSSSLTDSITLTGDEQLKLAMKIGDRLIAKSIEGNEKDSVDRSWLGLMIMGKNEVTTRISSVGPDLYRGNSGIGMYFAFLASITGEKRFEAATIETIKPIIRFIDRLKNNEINERIEFSVGAFTGLSGIMYALFHIGKYIQRNDLIDIVYDNIDLLLKYIKKTSSYDLVSGLAGCLGVVISLYDNTTSADKKKQLLYLANEIYRQLKDNYTFYSEKSILWEPFEEAEGYTGFAHGTSGISANLMRLYNINKNEEILSLVEKSLSFERSMLNGEGTNWYINLNQQSSSLAWCHGAPGILLNRILLKKFGYDDEFLDQEIKIALTTTIENGFNLNNTLCHGDLGNLFILEYAAKILSDKKLEKRCKLTYEKFFKDYLLKSWDKGMFRRFENYGLMIGLSGVGYSILQNVTNHNLPNVLWLE